MSDGELILTDGLVRMDMILKPNQTARSGQNANSLVVEQGPTLWVGKAATVRLSMAQARRWSTWIHRREGRMHSFTGWQLLRVNPQGALGTADGAIGLTVDIADSQLALTGCGAYQPSVGDMISYRTANSGFYLGEIQADGAAVAGAVTVQVLPRPVAKHATPAVRRVQALGEFEITTDLDPFEDYTDRTLSFDFQQLTRD